jgi:molecular chaperone HtpG
LTTGTHIILHLKKDQTQYVEDKTIKDLVKKHSEFIAFPIYLHVTKFEEKVSNAFAAQPVVRTLPGTLTDAR